MKKWFMLALASVFLWSAEAAEIQYEGLPLYYWQQQKFVNFGDYLSLKLVERIVDCPVKVHRRNPQVKVKKLLAIGSLMSFALDDDVIWGTGVNGRLLDLKDYPFSRLDVRAVRGPLTRKFLMDNFGIPVPEIYGDPALLVPHFFPEFQRKENPSFDYIVVVHYSEVHLFPREPHIVYATDPWDQVIERILDAKFVISTALHGLILAEAFGVPARMLRVTENEHLFKYQDYYLGTGRSNFQFATSIDEALRLGGEPPFVCDLEKLFYSFPFEFWPKAQTRL
ncbi:MAG: polysaccharide pyruvyl transferase family protein [Verrucomicrobia bacterium]|nr:polysaccharide pyruvyl transferase family protein [Verrucomicrobiota bacterium]